jgi:glutamate formiminotransferase/formiminotetrahydrofolate cyclodeaminase
MAFESAQNEARKLNVALAGSELVGLIPLNAILNAAEYYMKIEGLMILEEDMKIKLVVDRLGLNAITPFDPKKKIIEYMIEENNEPLANLTLRGFIDEIGARTSSPGGGSAAAAIAAIGAALGTMVAQLTYGIRKFEAVDKEMRAVLPKMFETYKSLIPMIDKDTQAFDGYMEAMRLPKETEEEQKFRNNKMQEELKKAVEVPFGTMKIANSIWNEMKEVARFGNLASHSDVEVGAKALETGIWGAYRNVLINLPTIEDAEYKARIIAEAEKIVEEAKTETQEILNIIDERVRTESN